MTTTRSRSNTGNVIFDSFEQHETSDGRACIQFSDFATAVESADKNLFGRLQLVVDMHIDTDNTTIERAEVHRMCAPLSSTDIRRLLIATRCAKPTDRELTKLCRGLSRSALDRYAIYALLRSQTASAHNAHMV
jgi:hypothetical protein